MRVVQRLSFSCLLLFLLWAQTTAAERPMTVEDVLALKQVSDPQMAPDGSAVAYVVSIADAGAGRWTSDLWLVTRPKQASAGTPRQLTFQPGRDFSPRWSPDSRWLAFLSVRGEGTRAQIYLLPIAGGEARALTQEPQGVQRFAWARDGQSLYYLAVEPPPKPDPQAGQVQVEDEGRAPARLWQVAVATGEKRRVLAGDFHISDFALSPDGNFILYAAAPTSYFNDWPRTELFLVQADGAVPARQLTRNGWGEADFVWRPDSTGFLFLSEAEAAFSQRVPQSALFYFDLARFEVRGLLPDFPGAVEQADWLDNETVLLVAGHGVAQHLYRLAFRSGKLEAVTSGAAVDAGLSFSRATQRIAFTRSTPERPADIWLHEVGGEPRALTDHNPQVRELALGRYQVVRWKASDDVEVEGIVYTPGGPGPWPLVTLIHGGPAAAEMANFAASAGRPVHLLTALGCAVFLPNYRGSTNYGAAFAARSVGDRNGRDAQDIEEGIDALIARSIADPKRLALMGWSAGGVLTNWLIANNPRYRAASTGAGVADWTFQYFLSDYTFGSDYYLGGTPWEKQGFYWERSPLRLAAQVRTPTLVHSGANDERVPIAHTRAWYRALKAFGVATRFVVYGGEPHTLQQLAHQRRKLEEDLTWFRQYLLGR